MHTVTLTRAGRAAARAGTTLRVGPAPKATLSPRAWEVLALLWATDQRGEPLKWEYSKTIEFVLIDKHIPPLAASIPGGYEITDRGRQFYREAYAAHTAAHPGVRAPHPDGVSAELWPSRADDILTRHRKAYRALCGAWEQTDAARQGAEAEAATTAPEPDPLLPVEVAEQLAARFQLWHNTARQRAELAAAHAEDIGAATIAAARAYAAVALDAFRAAVTRTDPLDRLREPENTDGWDEQRLAPPEETGIHAIDAEAKKLHAAAVGRPLRRRGPAPTPRPASVTFPGHDLAALADFLRRHTSGGTLSRRLHPLSLTD